MRTTLGLVSGLPPVVGIAAGQLFSLAWTADGQAWAWGANEDGQLGINQQFHNQLTPVQINIGNVISMSGGNRHSLMLKSDGTVWACGRNFNFQLGDGTDTHRLVPVQVKKSPSQYLTDIVAISAGGTHSLAISSDGKVWTWGHGTSGQLGNGNNQTAAYPVRVKKNDNTDLTNIKSVVAGLYHSLALTTDGKVWAWGLNDEGQLGLGDLALRTRAVQIPGLSGVVSIAIGAGGHYSMALKSDGTVWTWGKNDRGQLGDCSSDARRLTPGPTSNLSGITAIAGFRERGIALNAR